MVDAPFIWGDGGQATTKEEVERRRKLAQALIDRGSDFSPVQHWTQGAARVANALAGAMQMKYAGDDERASKKAAEADYAPLIGSIGGATPGVPVASAAPSAGGSPVGGFTNAVNRTLGFEGGLNPADTNGTPSNFGINQAANPDVAVKDLTKDQAIALYKSRYWDTIGGDQLAAQNPALAHVAFDTSVIAGPGKAKKLLAAASGDPNKVLQLREEFQNRLLASNPDKYGPYAKAWSNRIAGLRSDVGYTGTPQPAAVAGSGGQDTLAGGDTLGTQPAAAPAAPAAAFGAGQANVAQAMKVLNNDYATAGQKAVAQAIVQRALTPQTFTYQTDQAGNVVQMDPRGVVPPKIVYTSPTKPTYGVVGKDQFGNDQYGWIDPVARTVTPAQGGAQPGAAPGAPGSGPQLGPNGRPMVAGPNDKPIEVPEGADPKAFREKMTAAAAERANGPKGEVITSLRKEIQDLPSYKSYSQAIPAYNSMIDAAKRDTKAADLNLVYALAKIFDPTSVVREGELQMANDTQGVADRLIGMFKSVNGGARLGKQARSDLIAEATSRMSAFRQAHDADLEQFNEIADASGIKRTLVIPRLPQMGALDPKDIAGGVDVPGAAAPSPPPKPGEIPPAPKNVDPKLWPAIWQAMTPEERAAWK